MSDWERVKLELEAKKKSGWLAAILNLAIPGAGYIYCGRIILGIFVLLVGLLIYFTISEGFTISNDYTMSKGELYGSFVMVLFIDGFLCANRCNKKTLLKLLAQNSNNNSASLAQDISLLSKLEEMKNKGEISVEQCQLLKNRVLSDSTPTNKSTKKKVSGLEILFYLFLLAFGLGMVFLGSVHIIDCTLLLYPDIVQKDSFGYSDTFINIDKIQGMPWLAAETKYPIGCKILQDNGYIEYGGAFTESFMERIHKELMESSN